MKSIRAFVVLLSIGLAMAAQSASAGLILYTMTIMHNGTTSVGDPLGVGGLSFDGNGIVSVAKSIDSLTPMITAAIANGTTFDLVKLVGFDGAASPAQMLGTYEFADVLFTSQVLQGTQELVTFDPATTTYARV
jgi:hypothetical protein